MSLKQKKTPQPLRALDAKEEDPEKEPKKPDLTQSVHFGYRRYHSGPYRFAEEALRALRLGVEKRDDRFFRDMLEREIPNQEKKPFDSIEKFYILALLFASPPNGQLLRDLGSREGGTPRMAAAAFDCALRSSCGKAAEFRRIFDILSECHKRWPEDPFLAACYADYAMLAGRAEEAEKSLVQSGSHELFNVRAMRSLMRGDRKGAIEFYEKGIRRARQAASTRGGAFSSWTGVFYFPLFMSMGGELTEKDVGKNRLSGRVNATHVPFLLAESFLRGRLGQEKNAFFELGRHLRDSPMRCLDMFLFLLFAFWLDAERAREFREEAEATLRRLEALGLTFPAEELATLIRTLWPEIAECYGHIPAPPYPLKDLMGNETAWERSLSALSGIGAGTESPERGSRRFVWELGWTAEDGCVAWMSLTPVEQVLKADGWSRGRRVALRRLYDKNNSLSSMTAQDCRAASAIRKERGYYGAEYSLDIPQALEALVGHPWLFREGARVELTADEPRLTAVSENGGYRLSLSPFPRERVAPYRVILEAAPDSLHLTRFEDRHVRIARILCESGLFIPGQAKDALLKALNSLAPVVTIHSDIEGVEVNAEKVKADSRVHVQIQPSREGLDVNIIVRPLGPNGVVCRPGVGGVNLFSQVGSRQLQTRRAIEEEKDALNRVLCACPALAEAEQLAGERWHLPDTELSLEFLLQLQEMQQETVVVEWPKGQTMRVRRQNSEISVSVAARSSHDWFALSGELRVDEKRVLNMRELMERLRPDYGRFLPMGGGEFIALTREFRRRLELVHSLCERRGNELRVPSLSAALITPPEEESADLGCFLGDEKWNRQLRLIKESATLNPVPPPTFRGELRTYQLEGFRWLSRLAHWNAGACLADDMGLGKTIQTLALLAARGKDGPALVVAPTSVCSGWMDEARRFAPVLVMKELRNGNRERILSELGPMDVLVTTYGLLQSEIGRLESIHWHTVVLDEAQAIKNMTTRRSAAAMKLTGDFRMVTTGTPIENHLGELWNLFRFLNPHYLGSLESFNRRFAIPVERYGSREARVRLKRIIQPFILRRSKEQVLEELPPKTEITLRVELKGNERALYETLRQRALERLRPEDPQRFQIFAELMRLRRACCNVRLVLPEAVGGSGAKLEAFAEILAELRENNHRALVFSQFVDHLTVIRSFLDGEKISYQYLDGGTPPVERARRVRAFQAGEGDCFLISLKAGGTGLNLTAADYVIHMDPWWNPAVEEQASDRAHRIGQERSVTVYRIVAKDTIEEKIVNLHAWKRDLAESLLDETGMAPSLSAEEMLALIRET